MTIKDSFDTAGVVTTAGTLGRKSFIPNRDATVVARLRRAGAILLGKTNTPEFTMSYDTRNLLFGITKNPYDLTKSPGGSSGGAAAAIASGATPFDMGSDTGGSIRLPSCFCGTAGIKPTTGSMPLTGHIICTGLGAVDPLTQVGPMARFVEDLFPLLQITAGPDDIDPAVIPVPLQNPNFVKLTELRVAFHTDNGIQQASEDVTRVINLAASALSDAGARVDESHPQAVAQAGDLFTVAECFEGYEWIKLLLKRSGTEHWDPHIDWFLNIHPYTGKEAGDMLRDWQQFRSSMLAWMRRFDVLICPVYSQASLAAAFDCNPEMLKGFSYTSAFNFTGWPGAVVRGGTSSDSMPIGVQGVAHPWREDVCLAVAKHLETVLGGWQKPNL
jgi:amidase